MQSLPAHPRPASHGVLLTAILAAYAFINPALTPYDNAQTVAIIIGLGITSTIAIELRHGIKAVMAADLFVLFCFYGLTLLEFLFPQPDFNRLVSPAASVSALEIVLLGYLGIALGRLAPASGRMRRIGARMGSIGDRGLPTLFLIVFTLGFLHVVLAIGFDLERFIQQATSGRWNASWERDTASGMAKALYDLGLFLYAVPAVAAVIYARRERNTVAVLALVSFCLFLTFLYALSSGTRSLLAAYTAVLGVTYVLARPRVRTVQTVVGLLIVIAASAFATYQMIEFRNQGLSNYLGSERASLAGSGKVFIDYNLANISDVTEVVPSQHDYIGLPAIGWILIKPIPRALWPGKPENAGLSVEQALGAEGLTLSATFAGEAYMIFGLAGTLAMGGLLGWLSRLWTAFGSQAIRSSYGVVIYATGFGMFAISCRSIYELTTLALPIIGVVIIVKSLRGRAQMHTEHKALASQSVAAIPAPPIRH